MAVRVAIHERSSRLLTTGKKKPPIKGANHLSKGAASDIFKGSTKKMCRVYTIQLITTLYYTFLFWLRVEPLQIDPSHGAGAQESQISDNDL